MNRGSRAKAKLKAGFEWGEGQVGFESEGAQSLVAFITPAPRIISHWQRETSMHSITYTTCGIVQQDIVISSLPLTTGAWGDFRDKLTGRDLSVFKSSNCLHVDLRHILFICRYQLSLLSSGIFSKFLLKYSDSWMPISTGISVTSNRFSPCIAQDLLCLMNRSVLECGLEVCGRW